MNLEGLLNTLTSEQRSRVRDVMSRLAKSSHLPEHHRSLAQLCLPFLDDVNPEEHASEILKHNREVRDAVMLDGKTPDPTRYGLLVATAELTYPKWRALDIGATFLDTVDRYTSVFALAAQYLVPVFGAAAAKIEDFADLPLKAIWLWRYVKKSGDSSALLFFGAVEGSFLIPGIGGAAANIGDILPLYTDRVRNTYRQEVADRFFEIVRTETEARRNDPGVQHLERLDDGSYGVKPKDKP